MSCPGSISLHVAGHCLSSKCPRLTLVYYTSSSFPPSCSKLQVLLRMEFYYENWCLESVGSQCQEVDKTCYWVSSFIGFVERFETNSYPSLHSVTHQSQAVSTNAVFTLLLWTLLNRDCWDTLEKYFCKTSSKQDILSTFTCCVIARYLLSYHSNNQVFSPRSWPCYFSTVKFTADLLNINNAAITHAERI